MDYLWHLQLHWCKILNFVAKCELKDKRGETDYEQERVKLKSERSGAIPQKRKREAGVIGREGGDI